MSYYPFSVLGRDIALVSRQGGRRRAPSCTRSNATRPSLCVGASGSTRATWFFLAPGHDIHFVLATWLWEIGTVVGRDTSLVSRQRCDTLDQLWVATERAFGGVVIGSLTRGMKWCCKTTLGVGSWSKAARSRHGIWRRDLAWA